MNLSDLTSNGVKPWLTIVGQSLDCTQGFGIKTGIIDFENIPISLSPLPGYTILYTDSTNQGRPTINNGVSTYPLAYVNDVLNQSIGYLYYEDTINAGIVLSSMIALNTQYVINNVPTVLGLSSNFLMPLSGRLQYTGSTQLFKIQMLVSFANSDFGTDIRNIYFWGYKNGSVVTGSSSRFLTVAGLNFVAATCNFVASLSNGDYIELYVSNQSASIVTSAAIQIGTYQMIISSA